MAEPARAPCAPFPELRIGLDTGGTFTDAVALDATGQVIASAKALTMHWDLAHGLGAALRTVLARLPPAVRREDIALISVSTTLATNAVVENRFSPICTVLIGFDERMIERSDLKRAGGGIIVRVRGGHEATGDEAEPLDEAGVRAAVAQYDSTVEAFAVAGMFSVRNPAHERRARELIRALSAKPVTCSHELSSQLDAPKRALTAALNARLTPQIAHLLEALQAVLEREAITAPVMVVKGDGTLMRAAVAREYPVETVLSGPAASVVGAGFLCGFADFVVADMGGTTTDVAIVRGGRPVVRTEGAAIGGWRTMVEAIDVHTCGLGGDSEVTLDREHRLVVGPRKCMPLSLLASQHPQVLSDLRRVAAEESPPRFAGHYALRNPGRNPANLERLERRVWDALADAPRSLSQVAGSAQGVEALRRLVDRGHATLAGFTPSDAMHVLGRQQGWDTEAATLGATILATLERNALARRERESAARLCERIYEQVLRAAARVVIESALAQDPGIEPRQGRWGPLGRLLEELVAGRTFSALVEARLGLSVPLIGIGAPAATYYPEVARRLGAQLVVPLHAAVCNAVGAVAGVVSSTCEVVVNQTALKVFRVHDPTGSRDYSFAEEAIADAKRVASALALRAAQRAGAREPHIETWVTERRAHVDAAEDFLAEAVVYSRATGRPATGRLAQE
jgi:N-methylhydantoinase A/oxoprolinase/acetone carboxylase beta subunit